MTTPIANVTAVYDGELVEVNDDVDRGKMSTLLSRGDEVVIHEVLHEEQIEDLKARYPDDWEETVRFDDAGDAAGAGDEAADEDEACSHCGRDDCDGERAFRVTLATNQDVFRCQYSEPEVGDYVAAERVTRVEELWHT